MKPQGFFKHIVSIESDLLDIEMPENGFGFLKCSNTRGLDNNNLFTKFWELLRQVGEILIQCEGKGNLGSTHIIHEQIRKGKRFKQYFGHWKNPWKFAT